MASKPQGPKRSVTHRVVFGSCLVLAGLFLVASVALLVVSIVLAARFLFGGAD
jgi:hypothetical protein